ncbi:MAG: DUF2804 domain-containing protein [Bacilli bacterium]|nr:DUF2804 domain-containing protein [Bacilli bacterium]
MGEQHLMGVGPLLDENGNLAEPGYAFSLVKEYDRNKIKAGKSRIKEWDYYWIGNKDHSIALTVADNGYMSLVSASILVFGEHPWEITKSVMGLFPMGKLNMPSHSKEGDVHFQKGALEFHFVHEGEKKRRLTGFYPKFGKNGEDLHWNILLEETSDNSMVIATPWPKKHHFYYNQKINNQKANGYFKCGEQMFDVSSCYGVLDWGRGVWTYSNTWYWSSLNSEIKGVPFGWNMGYGFGDTKAASENMVFYGEKAYKLDDVRFDIPLDKKGNDDYMSPWKFRSSTGDVQVDFRPLLDRHANTNALIIQSKQHQVFGLFSGFILVEDQKINFENLLGFTEKVHNRY